MEFIDRLDSAIYDIESQLEDHVENLALLNQQTDDLREKIGLLENSYRNSWRDGGKVDFESAMQKHIDDADGDAADAVDSRDLMLRKSKEYLKISRQSTIRSFAPHCRVK
jgi:hypothetical protein